jgi:Arc/MetJ family transcription regulator
MKSSLHRLICGTLIVTSVLMPYAAQTQAAMIGTGQAIAASQSAERDKVRAFLARADVQRQLAALGAANPADRVNALTDDEAQSLASRIDALPAGADISVAAALLIVLILVLLVFLMDSRRR